MTILEKESPILEAPGQRRERHASIKGTAKAQNKWIAKAYDRINLTVPKGKKDTIQAHAEAQGESVNGFINRAIDNQISQDRHKGPSEDPESTGESFQETERNSVTAKED